MLRNDDFKFESDSTLKCKQFDTSRLEQNGHPFADDIFNAFYWNKRSYLVLNFIYVRFILNKSVVDNDSQH